VTSSSSKAITSTSIWAPRTGRARIETPVEAGRGSTMYSLRTSRKGVIDSPAGQQSPRSNCS
jgi:hypothetical protein